MPIAWLFVSLVMSFVLASPAVSQVESGTGDPMRFDLGYGIVVNEDSTVDREWSVVNDPRLPIALQTFTGLDTVHEDRDWAHEALYVVNVKEPITAFEVRFIPFNIWGEQGTTLSSTQIYDLSTGATRFTGTWRLYSENEAVEHFGSVAFVAQVRLADGTILKADLGPVLDAARAFADDVTEEDLDVPEE